MIIWGVIEPYEGPYSLHLTREGAEAYLEAERATYDDPSIVLGYVAELTVKP